MLGNCEVFLYVPCHGLVEERVRLRLSEQSQRRITADDVVEVRVIDMERLLRERLVSNTRPEELL